MASMIGWRKITRATYRRPRFIYNSGSLNSSLNRHAKRYLALAVANFHCAYGHLTQNAGALFPHLAWPRWVRPHFKNYQRALMLWWMSHNGPLLCYRTEVDLLLNSEHAPRNRRPWHGSNIITWPIFPFSFVFYQKHLHSNSERLRSFNSSDFEFNFLWKRIF